MPLNLPTDYDVCGKKFLVPHALSCPKVGLVLELQNDAAKEWVTLLAQALNPSYISYESKINSRTVRGDRNGAIARVETIVREGGENKDREGETGQVTVPCDS